MRSLPNSNEPVVEEGGRARLAWYAWFSELWRKLRGIWSATEGQYLIIDADGNVIGGDGPTSSSSGIEDAPSDGNVYGRQDASWTIIRSSGLRYTFSAAPPSVVGEGDEWMESDTGILYTYVLDGSSGQWVELGQAGAGASAGGVQVDIYSTPGTTSWTKPAGAEAVEVFVVGGGGGGGAGGKALGILGFNVGGGCGGGAGAYVHFAGPASGFSSTETVVVGAGGAGGIGFVGGGTYDGNDGANGGQSSFGNIIAYGGGYGEGGSNFLPTGAGGSAGFASGANGATGGNFGGVNGVQGAGADVTTFGIGSPGGWGNGAVSSRDGGRAMFGAQGGGGGGDTVNCAGGDAYEFGRFAAATMTGGTNEGEAGTSAYGTIARSLRGAGGGGGAGVYAANQGTLAGGNGGHGQQPGGGGGGGGASIDNGDGGNGGAGIVVVVTYTA